MAKHHQFLLLLLLLTFTTTAVSQPGNTVNMPQQMNNIIDALIGAGDFNSFANMISMADPTFFPLSATFFIPSDDSLPTVPSDPFIFPYHIVPQRLTFTDLCLLKPLSRLPTLLVARSILVTNTSLSNFTIDNSLLTSPDLYLSSRIAVHGIRTAFDYSVYGTDAPPSLPEQPKPTNVLPEVSSPPERPPKVSAPAGNPVIDGHGGGGGRKSDAACLCWEFPVVFVIACGILGFKAYWNPFARL